MDEYGLRYAIPVQWHSTIFMRDGKNTASYFVCFVAKLLVVQLVLASGHVHFAASHVEHASAVLLAESGDNSPEKQHPAHRGLCPLCWAQAAAGSLLLPVATFLPHPLRIGCSNFTALEHLAELIQPASFEPRGPPLYI